MVPASVNKYLCVLDCKLDKTRHVKIKWQFLTIFGPFIDQSINLLINLSVSSLSIEIIISYPSMCIICVIELLCIQ